MLAPDNARSYELQGHPQKRAIHYDAKHFTACTGLL